MESAEDSEDALLQQALLASLCDDSSASQEEEWGGTAAPSFAALAPPRFPGQLADAESASSGAAALSFPALAPQRFPGLDEAVDAGSSDSYSGDETERILKRIKLEDDTRLKQEQDAEYSAMVERDRARRPPTSVPPAVAADTPGNLLIKFRLPNGTQPCWRFHGDATIEHVRRVAAYHAGLGTCDTQLFLRGRAQKYRPLAEGDGTLEMVGAEDRELVLVREAQGGAGV